METWDLESSEQSVPTTSIYFTSILPPPATGQNEEIQIKGMREADGKSGVEIIYSGCQDIRHGELFSGGADSVATWGGLINNHLSAFLFKDIVGCRKVPFTEQQIKHRHDGPFSVVRFSKHE